MTDALPRRDAAGVILFHRAEDGTRLLILRNAKHGTWGFPKGHAEAGESTLETARRETEEETGVTEFRLLSGFEDEIEYDVTTRTGPARKVVTYFLGEVERPTFRRSDEHDADRWATEEEAGALITHENLRGVLRRAAARCREASNR